MKSSNLALNNVHKSPWLSNLRTNVFFIASHYGTLYYTVGKLMCRGHVMGFMSTNLSVINSSQPWDPIMAG